MISAPFHLDFLLPPAPCCRVFIEDTPVNPIMPMLHAVARLVFPILFSFLLIKFAFR